MHKNFIALTKNELSDPVMQQEDCRESQPVHQKGSATFTYQFEKTHKVFLLIANTTKSNVVISCFRITDTVRTMSSIAAKMFCGLSSQRSQRGRQVKFLSKKSSLQVRLVMFKAGRNLESLTCIAEDPM